MSHAIRTALTLSAAILTTACSSRLARIEHQWGAGPVRAEEDGAVILPRGDSIASIPLRASPEADGWLNRCTVRGVWLDRAERERVAAVPADSIPDLGLFQEATQFRLDSVALFTFEPGLVQPARADLLTFDFPRRLTSDPSPGQVRGDEAQPEPADQRGPEEALLVELWLTDAEAICDETPLPPPAVPDINVYLVDFETIYPQGSTASRGGVWVIGVLALAVLGGVIAGS